MVATIQTPSRRPRIVPDAYVLLSNWRYIEYNLLRVIAGWGRCAEDWDDKLAVCFHTWVQAEIVDRLRKRIDMYPGGKKDGPVHAAFEALMNAVLLAPSWKDAMAGVHAIVNPALVAAYTAYASSSHPVHDRPTFDLLREILAFKREQATWYESFRQRYPHSIDRKYELTLRERIAGLGNLKQVIEPGEAPHAKSCGANNELREPQRPGRVKNWNVAPHFMPLVEIDWSHNVEARRLFFMVAYVWEMGVAEQQLRWIYYADFMPFEFIHAESRHMWDESRHGDSGYHRCKDAGLDFEHFGYSSYGANGDGFMTPMTPLDVYNSFYGVTQIAETGYFETKRNCFEDFAAGNDDASAEMMQFDIIDETSHVEYGRIWLDEMMNRVGVEEDYRKRGAKERIESQKRSDDRVARLRRVASGAEEPADQPHGCWPAADRVVRDPKAIAHYRWLLRHVRDACPMTNASDTPTRPNLPM